MKRKIKILGILLASLLAPSLIGASAASAAEFHSSAAPVGITGTQTSTHAFTLHSGTQIVCETATFNGTTSFTTSGTQTLTPDYTSCKFHGLLVTWPLHHNGCSYIFYAKGTTEIECPVGKKLEFTAPGCTITIGPQHFATGMTYTNVGSSPNRHIIAHASISGITYNECGTVRTDGTYTGATTVDSASGELWFKPDPMFHTTLTTFVGEQSTEHVLNTNAGSVTCKEVVLGGYVAATNLAVTMEPFYEGCKAFGFINVPIDVNGCSYRFTPTGTTNIECPSGKQIEITAPGCTTAIGAQHLSSGMTYTTVGAAPKRYVIAHTSISGIKYDECGTIRTNGTYKGSTAINKLTGDTWVT